ncbi:hypothetical protein DAPPUDRAFT_100114 [Daphnia pulex]|uniref:Cytochrome b n=1 Tax=Daphnia pulex TaxID=6669 RepID=E9G9E1_DAPPU|nr:hypothetical protein DAPPUDRAFT_100114 [Daphnia pulex]|eukprot:EFX83891.1 hypothetical protein DAPPUDRAFT_100114 [Daphnia pulex]
MIPGIDFRKWRNQWTEGWKDRPKILLPQRLERTREWIDDRLPIFSFARKELKEYPTPYNLSFLWNFGFLAGIILMVMILSGLFLAMFYTPHVDFAFDSVERIMRDVNYGWLIRYIHMNGASFFFIVIYIHMFRGLYYGSYKSPREVLWILGVVIYLLMMATAFMGYVLPWGQMSFWGATVITNLFSAIPWIGEGVVHFLWGGYSVANPILNRFFVLHFLFPFLICAVVFLHLVALHRKGSNNPLGIERTKPEESIPFHPHFGADLGKYCFFLPPIFLENPIITSLLIPWAVPSKLAGVALMFSAILVLFILPWLDRSPVRSARFRPLYKWFFWVLVGMCLILGWSGSKPPEGIYLWSARIGAFYYFFHFVVILPWLSFYEKPLPLPTSLLPEEEG